MVSADLKKSKNKVALSTKNSLQMWANSRAEISQKIRSLY